MQPTPQRRLAARALVPRFPRENNGPDTPLSRRPGQRLCWRRAVYIPVWPPCGSPLIRSLPLSDTFIMNHDEILIKSLEVSYKVTLDNFLVTLGRVVVISSCGHDTLARYRGLSNQRRLT
jgi:hypothetical protein